MQRLRIGLVGAGRRGRQHAATITELPDLYELVGVCDLDGNSARALADWVAARAALAAGDHDARPDSPHPYTSLRDFLVRESLDGVLIATPPDTHHLAAVAAAEAGVPMLVETPLALTRAMMDLIGERAERAGVPVEVGENYGRRPAEQLNRVAIQSGAIGQLLHLSAFNAPANHGTVYHTMSLFRLYANSDVAEVQAVDRTHRLPSAASAQGEGSTAAATASPAPASEVWTDAQLTFDHGVTASLSFVSTWASPLRRGRPRIVTVDGTDGHLSAADTTMVLHRLEEGGGVDYPLEVETTPDSVPVAFAYRAGAGIEYRSPFPDRRLTESAGAGDGIARAVQLRVLYEAVTAGAPVGHPVAEARRSQEVGIALVESARLGRAISSHLGEETVWEREQHRAFRERWGADPLKDVEALLSRLK